jgi:hypothetical protein
MAYNARLRVKKKGRAAKSGSFTGTMFAWAAKPWAGTVPLNP